MSANFAKINKTLWNSEKFKNLNEIDKLLYLYLLTSSQSNSCGCYVLKIGYIMVDLEWNQEQVKAGIEAVEKTGLIRYEYRTDTVYLNRWFDFNGPQNPKHALKIISDIEKIPYGENVAMIIADFSKALDDKGWKIEKSLRYRIDRVCQLGHTCTKTKTKIEKEKDKKEKAADTVSRQEDPADDHDALPDEKPVPEKSYAFQGEVIRLVQKDFDTFRKRAVHLSDAAFQNTLFDADRFFANPENPSGGKSWFHRLGPWLDRTKPTVQQFALNIDKPFAVMNNDERKAAGYRYENDTFTWYDRHDKPMEEPQL